MWVRIYGSLGALIISFVMLGLMIAIQKCLPDGSKSQFHPTWSSVVGDSLSLAKGDKDVIGSATPHLEIWLEVLIRCRTHNGCLQHIHNNSWIISNSHC